MKTPSIQTRIEKVMRSFHAENRWECIQLYSADGLLMAGQGKSPVYNHDHLLEFSFSLIQTAELLGPSISDKEIVIRGTEKRRLVFQFFEAWGETVVLAAVLNGRKGYRRAMLKLVKLIQNIS